MFVPAQRKHAVAVTMLVAGAALATAAFLAAAGAVAAPAPGEARADLPPPGLATAPVTTSNAAAGSGHDGVVQAVRRTVIAAQVSGAVVELPVKAGDTVKAGQVLVRLDARAAEQTAAAGAAQVQAARAAMDAATREYERQKQLFEQRYISRAALERAEAQHKAAQAEAQAQLATAGAARTQSGFYVVRAPYAGVVSDVPVVLGDMAMPGRPLMTLYDPSALRVSVPVPQTLAARLGGDAAAAQVEIPGAVAGRITPVRLQALPTADAATHTQEVWLDLPATKGVTPGMFARAWLAAAAASEDDTRLFVPASAIVRRAELVGLYVVQPDGRALLRQVRLGRAMGERVEVLSGVSAGEHVALDPQAAARKR